MNLILHYTEVKIGYVPLEVIRIISAIHAVHAESPRIYICSRRGNVTGYIRDSTYIA